MDHCYMLASKKGIPSVIQEQNSYPGITNRLLGRHVDKVCVLYYDMDRFFPKKIGIHWKSYQRINN